MNASSSWRASSRSPSSARSSCRSTGGSCPTSWRSSSRTPARRCSSTAASSPPRSTSSRGAATATTVARRGSRSAATAPDWAHRLRTRCTTPRRADEIDVETDDRRPALHHVHLGHDRPAEGRDAHPRHGAVGDRSPSTPRPTMRFGDRYLVALPLFHVGALTPAIAASTRGVTQRRDARVRPGARRGSRSRSEQRHDRPRWCRRCCNFMLQAARRRRASTLAQLRWIMSGAAPVPVDADRGATPSSASRSTRSTGSPRAAGRPA